MSNILGCDKIFLPDMKYKRLVVKEIVVKQIVLKQEGCNSWRVAYFLFFAWMRVSQFGNVNCGNDFGA